MRPAADVSDRRGSDEETLREAVELVEWLERRDAVARLIGGAGIVLHCDSLGGSPHRPLADIDLIAPREAGPRLAAAMEERGYEAAARFNAMHGHARMMFAGPAGKVDVFIDEFSMCHRLDLRSRLELDRPTLTATDLLLTKLQIVELNEKDAADIAVLLRDHELGEGDGDLIDVAYVCSLVRDDWGLWRTVTGTLVKVGDAEPELAAKVDELRTRIDAVEKTRRFRIRARIGERRRWYELPEDTPGW